jgi:hypothetical protein
MQYVPNVPQPRRTLAVPLMAAAVLGAGIATATFAIVNIEDQPIVSLPTPAEESTAVPSDAVAGQRADGGPEEGTAQAITVVPAASSAAGAARYDGGPNEGTAQSITAQRTAAGSPEKPLQLRGEALNRAYGLGGAAAATRYDGGPEEGTRGATTESSSGGSSGPVPFSGMRP